MISKLDYAFQISKEAYKQEVERREIIHRKSEYLIKWITIFISVFNIAIPIIAKEIKFECNDCTFIVLYSILMCGLVGAMISLVLLEYPQKVKCYPLGYEILNNKKNKLSEENVDLEIIYNNILIQDSITKKLSQSNNRAANKIIVANICIILAIISLSTLFVYMICSV